MRYYETLYLINPELAEEECRGVIDKFNSLIEKNNGVVVTVDEWGKKTLAYPIKKFDKGYYVLLQYCGESDIISILKRDLKLDDRILKYQTIKLNEDVDPKALLSEAKAVEGTEPAETTEPDSKSSQESENGIQE